MQFYIIDCDIKTITNAAESKQTVKFTPKCTAISVEKSAFWNVNTTNEIRGYWVNKNDIKTFLRFDNDENLMVSIFFSYLRFYFMKKEILKILMGKFSFLTDPICLDPFLANVHLLYPLQIPPELKVFYFQGV